VPSKKINIEWPACSAIDVRLHRDNAKKVDKQNISLKHANSNETHEKQIKQYSTYAFHWGADD